MKKRKTKEKPHKNRKDLEIHEKNFLTEFMDEVLKKNFLIVFLELSYYAFHVNIF